MQRTKQEVGGRRRLWRKQVCVLTGMMSFSGWVTWETAAEIRRWRAASIRGSLGEEGRPAGGGQGGGCSDAPAMLQLIKVSRRPRGGTLRLQTWREQLICLKARSAVFFRNTVRSPYVLFQCKSRKLAYKSFWGGFSVFLQVWNRSGSELWL